MHFFLKIRIVLAAVGLLTGGTLFSTSSYAYLKPIAKTPLQIDSHRNDVFWLDNNTVVFVGADTSKERDASGMPPVKFPDEQGRIYIWRLSGQPEVYRPDIWPQPGTFASRNYVCAAEGKIYYSARAPTRTASPPGLTGQILAGVPGKERAQEFRLVAVDPRWSQHSSQNYSGKRCDQLYAPWMEQNFWRVSFDQRTILDLGQRTSPVLWKPLPVGKSGKSVRLVDVNTRKTKVVRDVDAHWTRYACVNTPSWEATFIVWRCLAGEDAEMVRTFPVWKIFANGRAERTDIETGSFNDPALIPYRDGYYLLAWGEKGSNSYNAAVEGLYLVRGGKPVLALKGYYRAQAISPNGCKAALSQATRHEYGDARESLIVLNLCESEGFGK